MSSLLAALQKHQARSGNLYTDKVDTTKLKPGSVVVVRGGFGDEPPEQITVEGVEYDEDKNDYIIDYTDKKGDGRWAYINQIQKVISY